MKLLLNFIENPSNSLDHNAKLLKDPRIKRLMDVILSLLALIITTPVFIIIALIIKLDDMGPIFYCQQRFTRGLQKFTIIKFRTMTADDHPINKEDYVKKQDHRLTKIGKFLRDTSLDELPQLVNVLKGEMSVVGPRPQAIPQIEYYLEHIKNYNDRHMVKPGLTGLVQISDLRSEVRPEEQGKRLKFDILYINNWSISLDLFVISSTLIMLWSRYKSNLAIYGSRLRASNKL